MYTIAHIFDLSGLTEIAVLLLIFYVGVPIWIRLTMKNPANPTFEDIDLEEELPSDVAELFTETIATLQGCGG